MKTLAASAFVVVLAGCAATTLNKTDPSFQLKSIEGKNIVIENNALVEFAGFLDLDAAYAGGVFKDAYPSDTVYSNEFVKRFSEAFTNSTRSKLMMLCDRFDSASCRDKNYDYRVTLDNLKFHNRLGLDAFYSVYDKQNKKVLGIEIDNMDKISLGASGRFREAFVNLSKEDSENVEKDWKTLQ